ncbi:hypothetical protein PPERSA_00109 [Pseudocohnilembus persalinus]|uniref:CWC16 protein n=1 Tax=Pseudocohnilembus persalinus TaxID=266149 RepID=A0A0V0Q8H9_PSEPJ|nr:hypothetical protein PPERSA_00109 [Pseudocohnilembus persalinus]|eukprot:KRW98512.1 hypothetical protein PPERSA_00109 [Pseudocohnilembus persalinus]
MSTLKASRADGFYYPPEYDFVGGSINKFQKSHPLGVRAKKIDQGILVVRYETPFHVKCEKCENMIGKGVRFNAEKKQVGNFHSTKIWEFSMKCPSCKNKIVVRTDPEHCQYRYIQGAKQILNTENASEGQFIEDAQDKIKAADPFKQLERNVQDIQQAEAKKPEIGQIIKDQDDKFKDDFLVNLKMRRKFKDEKKIIEEKERIEKQPKNFALRLVTPCTTDIREAQNTKFKQQSQAGQNTRKDREKIRAQDIFLHSKNYSQYQNQNQIEKAKKMEELY